MNTLIPVIDSFAGDYRWLSNFYPCVVRYAGHSFDTLENAYQASKCKDDEDRLPFTEYTPGKAKRKGQKVEMRDNWEQVKLVLMEYFLTQKFAKGSMLANMLIATGDAEIIEGNQWNDTYWGVCEGKGGNHLGKLIMKIRQELQND